MKDSQSSYLARVQRLFAEPRAGLALALLTSTLCVLTAFSLLRSAYSAFTWGKFDLFDYGIYTNMIWNCGRGRPFLFLVDQSYLRIHLSFTLALLGPLFYLWDHPFLLSLVQWLMLIVGCGIICTAGRRHGLPPEAIAATALLYLVYPFTQTAALTHE